MPLLARVCPAPPPWLYPASYRGFNGTDPNNVSAYNIWSAINVQNLEATPATVTLQYTPRADSQSQVSKTINATIPANSADGWNTRTSTFS